MTDYENMSDEELQEILDAVQAEYSKRMVIRQAAEQLDAINTNIQSALGRSPGEDWIQPTGAHDAYPRWWEVKHNEKFYTSLIPANTTTPGSDPRWWKEINLPTEEPEVPVDPNAPKEWNGEYFQYLPDEKVTYKGVIYRVVQSHTSQPGWTPDIVPALYEKMQT